MTEALTQTGHPSVSALLDAVVPERRRQDAWTLHDLISDVTGLTPTLWGGSIVGYGQYAYRYDSGRSGVYFRTGFAPRKSALTVYILPGYDDHSALLAKLGKHKRGRACLYMNKLADIDLEVLRALVRAGFDRMADVYPNDN